MSYVKLGINKEALERAIHEYQECLDYLYSFKENGEDFNRLEMIDFCKLCKTQNGLCYFFGRSIEYGKYSFKESDLESLHQMIEWFGLGYNDYLCIPIVDCKTYEQFEYSLKTRLNFLKENFKPI